MMELDLEKWLRAHSIKEERIDGKQIFTHPFQRESILLPRDYWRDDLLPVDMEPLSDFYRENYGASIGDGHLLFATNIEGGVQLSKGFRLPDLQQMKAQAAELGVIAGESEILFLAVAGWMFLYAVRMTDNGPRIVCYDRDFQTNHEV